MRLVRWRHVSLVFQGAMNSLDPVQRVDAQIAEAIRLHESVSGKEVRERIARAPDHGGPDAGARPSVRAPALGRPAPANDDRPRARLPPVAGDRRRADDGARRRDPGAGPAAARAPARAARAGAHPDLARPRRAGRDLRPDRDHVRGADRGDRTGRLRVRRPAASLHEAPARLASGDRRAPRVGRPDPGRPPGSGRDAGRAAGFAPAARTPPSGAYPTRPCARRPRATAPRATSRRGGSGRPRRAPPPEVRA